MNRISILQEIIRRTKAKTYVEIGVSKGDLFCSIRAPRKIGIDPVNNLPKALTSRGYTWPTRIQGEYSRWLARLKREESRFFELPSDDFFVRVPHIFSEHKIDVAFVDGLHTYEQAYRDVENCLKYLAPGGVILMHDCNPATEAAGVRAHSVEEAASKNVPGWEGFWCGDVWKAVVQLRTRPDLDVFVLDCDFGVGVITRSDNPSPLAIDPAKIADMTYQEFAADRTRLLNLKDPGTFGEFAARLRAR
jgi:hypothetical protein